MLARAGRYRGAAERPAAAVPVAAIGDVTLAPGCAQAAGATGRADLDTAARLTSPAAYRALPTWAMAGGRASELVDARIYDDALWVLGRYGLRVSAARERGHHTHGDGTALDRVPAIGTSTGDWDATAGRLARDLGWSAGCGRSGVRPACALKPAIQFVGYDGYPRPRLPAHLRRRVPGPHSPVVGLGLLRRERTRGALRLGDGVPRRAAQPGLVTRRRSPPSATSHRPTASRQPWNPPRARPGATASSRPTATMARVAGAGGGIGFWGAGPPCHRASADRTLACRRAQISSGRAANLRCAGLPSPLAPHHPHEPPAVHHRAHLVFGALSPAPSAGVVSTPAGHERLTLTAADVDAIAARVVELLRDEPPLAVYVDTSAVARMLHVSGDWVREHAWELGGIRIGDGPKGALRFELRRVRAALDQRRLARRPASMARRPGPQRRGLGGVELLPLPDEG